MIVAVGFHPLRAAESQWTPTQADSVAIIRAAWDVATMNAPRATVLWTPLSADADSAGVTLQFSSRWTEVLGTGNRRCRATSANVERFRVRRELGTRIRDDPESS